MNMLDLYCNNSSWYSYFYFGRSEGLRLAFDMIDFNDMSTSLGLFYARA